MSDQPNQVMESATLEDLAVSILGDLAFMIVDPAHDLAPDSGESVLSMSVEYRGPLLGSLRGWCSQAFARELMSLMTGADVSDGADASEVSDALGELMNVLCGNLVTTLYGKDQVFTLGIPQQDADAVVPPGPFDQPNFCAVADQDRWLILEHVPRAVS